MYQAKLSASNLGGSAAQKALKGYFSINFLVNFISRKRAFWSFHMALGFLSNLFTIKEFNGSSNFLRPFLKQGGEQNFFL
jgi:hypothetical protein